MENCEPLYCHSKISTASCLLLHLYSGTNPAGGKKQQILKKKSRTMQSLAPLPQAHVRLTCDSRIASRVLNVSYLIIYCTSTVMFWDVPPHSGSIYSNVLVSSRRLLGMNECFSVSLGCCSRIPECVSLNALSLSPESFLKIIRLITGSGYIYGCVFVCFYFLLISHTFKTF